MKQTELIHQVSLKLVALAVAWGLTCAAQGALYNFSSGAISQVIPDNNPSGYAAGITFGTAGLQITDVTVTFTTSGGYNGDLYAYLAHDSSGTLVLLNRVGTGNGTSGSTLYTYGYSGSGFNNTTLSDSGSGNIHNYGGTTLNSVPSTGGIYNADGAGGATFANTFGGSDPSGNWTLFFADRSGGSVSTLTGWSLDITAVPEPVNVALGIFAGVCLVVSVAQSRWVRARLQRCWVDFNQWVDAV